MALVPDPVNAGQRTWCRTELILFGALVALLVIVRHRSNIVRLLRGTELKIGQGARTSATRGDRSV
jgi:glycerol-3-phosphate acyltransferase PlsY